MATISQSDMAALLGRPLTATEVANYASYLEVAVEQVEMVLCFSLESGESTKTFKGRDGYSTVFTPIYESISEVKLNGKVTTDFTSYFFDDLDKDFYNSIVFDCQLHKGDVVQITAEWGFTSFPKDLATLISKYFALASSGTKSDSGLKSKKVEDVAYTFDTDITAEDRIANSNKNTIRKYSLCSVGNVQHGGVCSIWI